MTNNDERNGRSHSGWRRDRSRSPNDVRNSFRARSPIDAQRGNENKAGANNRNKSQSQSHSRTRQQEQLRNERLKAILKRTNREYSAAREIMNHDRNQAPNHAQSRAARGQSAARAAAARRVNNIPNSARTSNDWIADREQQRRTARRNNYGRAENPVVIEDDDDNDDEQENVPRLAPPPLAPLRNANLPMLAPPPLVRNANIQRPAPPPLLRDEDRESSILLQHFLPDSPRVRVAAVAPADVAPADVAPVNVAPADVAPAAPIVAPVAAPVAAPVGWVAAPVAPRAAAPVAPRAAAPVAPRAAARVPALVPGGPIRAYAVRRRIPPIFNLAPAGYIPQPVGHLRPGAPVFFAPRPGPDDDDLFPLYPRYRGLQQQVGPNVLMERRNLDGGMFPRDNYGGEPPGIPYYENDLMEEAHYIYDPPAHRPPVAPVGAPAPAPAYPAVVAPAVVAPAVVAPAVVAPAVVARPPRPDRRRLQEYNVLPPVVDLGVPHEWTRIHDETLATLLRARVEPHMVRWLSIENANNRLRDARPNHHHLAPPEMFEGDAFTDAGDDDEEELGVPEGEQCSTCLDKRANVQFNCHGRVGGEPHSACTRCVMEIWRTQVGMGAVERGINPLAAYLLCPMCRARVTKLTADNELGEFSEEMVAGRYVPVAQGQETEWVSVRPWIARRSQRYSKRIERQIAAVAGGRRGRRGGWAPY